MGLAEVFDSFGAKSPVAELEARSRLRLRGRQARRRARFRRALRLVEDPFLLPMLVFVVLVAILYLVAGHR